MQDVALSSRLPISVYKPQSVLSQAIFRVADKILSAKAIHFEGDLASTFATADSEAEIDYQARLPYVEDLMGSGAITVGELGETIKSQQYEITQLRKEINLLRTKLSKAVAQGFRL
jgi:flagellar biosynthesis protein FlhG